MENSTKELLQRVFLRFLRGFIATFVPILALMMQNVDLTQAALFSLLTSAVAGGLLAVDKFIRAQKWYKELHK